MKLVQSFRVFKYIDWMFYALGDSLRRYAIFFTAILPFFFGMILILHVLTGISVEETSTITIAIFSVYRFILGIAKSQDFIVSSPQFYYIWSYTLVLFYFYMVYPVSIAILLESYEETAMELGHVSDASS